jgi:menaquinone-dependent protoporphyrinogen oxidase
MTQRILIAYATKYGSTAGIARKIGDVLQAAGLTVDVQPADAVRDIAPYDAVILGSAVYAGQWRKEAVTLLEKQEQALAERPVWLFSSGPTGEGDPVEQMKGWTFPEAQRPIADRIRPRAIAFFHGDIDMDKLNFGEKLLVKGIRAPTGDFRDWEMITAWAQDVAEALKQKA